MVENLVRLMEDEGLDEVGRGEDGASDHDVGSTTTSSNHQSSWLQRLARRRIGRYCVPSEEKFLPKFFGLSPGSVGMKISRGPLEALAKEHFYVSDRESSSGARARAAGGGSSPDEVFEKTAARAPTAGARAAAFSQNPLCRERFLTIMAIIRNEDPFYIQQWIEYHLAAGAKNIFTFFPITKC